MTARGIENCHVDNGVYGFYDKMQDGNFFSLTLEIQENNPAADILTHSS